MIKNKLTKIVILIILAVLPALFPFGGRVDYIFDYLPYFIDTSDETFVPWVLIFAFFWITSIWCVYGFLFARWFGKSKTRFILCNLPIIVNAISEIVYYQVLGFTSADYPAVSFWIGSHIDKINPLEHIFGMGSVVLTIGISVLYYFLLFWMGYKSGLSTKGD